MGKSDKAEELNTDQLVNSLLKQLEEKDRQMAQLNQTIANLTETINELKHKIFGTSSEKSSHVSSIAGQLSLFGEPEEEKQQEPEMMDVVSHKKRKPRSTHDKLAKNIPVTIIDLKQ